MKRVYITGGTGFLGSHFIRNHLLGGGYDVQCFVRGKDTEECLSRLRQRVLVANTSYLSTKKLDLEALTAIRSDITQPLFGLTEECLASRAKEGDSTFFHFASSLNFEEKNRDVIYDHNINGVKHAVEVASGLGCSVFFYISTAYTVGTQEGSVPEMLHENVTFNNYYEETKCAAEHLITSLCEQVGMTVIIVRPSVVVGPSDSCKTGGSSTGIYGFIREMNRLSRHLKHTDASVALNLNSDAGLNVIPVDCVCRDIFEIYQDGPLSNGLYHATAANNVSVGGLVELVKKHLEMPNVWLCKPEQFDKEERSAIEKLLNRKTAFYTSVAKTTKDFQRRRGNGWILEMDALERFIIEGVRVLSSGKSSLADNRKVVVTSDQVELNVYASERPADEAVVFINAIGMPAEFSSHLRKSLQAKYRFITWESRGVPSVVEDVDAIDISLDAHISDLLCVLDHFGIKKAHVIGWCSGAYIAYHALKTQRLSSLTLICGAYGLSENTEDETSFVRNLRHILPLVAESRSLADRYHGAFFARASNPGTVVDDVRQASEILDATDPDLIHLTNKPFETPQLLYNYSRLITSLRQSDHTVPDGPLGVPCHIVTGLVDETVSPLESQLLHAKHPDATFSGIEAMDHFGIYTSPALTRDIVAFLDNIEKGQSLLLA